MSSRPTFFVDRCPGNTVVEALRAASVTVEVHDENFQEDEADQVWAPAVATRGWVILTKDKNIRRRAGEREAAITSGARIITLTSGNMRGADMAALFIAHITAMEELVTTQPAPFVAILGPSGLRVVLPRQADT